MNTLMYTEAQFLVVGDVIVYEGYPCRVLQAQHEGDSIYLHLFNKSEGVTVEGPQGMTRDQKVRVLIPRDPSLS